MSEQLLNLLLGLLDKTFPHKWVSLKDSRMFLVNPLKAKMKMITYMNAAMTLLLNLRLLQRANPSLLSMLNRM